MADLSVDDRGQVLLVTAFLLAASFVALAVVLNSAIYTENLATREESARGTEAISYRSDVVRGTEHLIEYSNHNNSGKTAIRDELAASVAATSNRSTTQQLVDGQLVNASLYAVTWGTRIGQNDTSGNFTNATAPASAPVEEDWTLATDVEGTRSFRINVTDSEELNVSGNDPFRVVLDDGSNTWKMDVYQDGGSPPKTTVDVVGGGDCTRGRDPTIDVTAGTVNGTACSALDFAKGVDPPYEIGFENGSAIQGTFTMVVNSTSYDDSNYATVPDVPFAVDAVYATTVHVRYESPDLIYETDARVIPGEHDE